MQSGYIYVLINAAHNHLVKVGKTGRTAEERATELSSSSGVPTKFAVFYSSPCVDIDSAEIMVHKALQSCRFNEDREFFEVDVDEAVQAVKTCVNLVNTMVQRVSDKAASKLREDNSSGSAVEVLDRKSDEDSDKEAEANAVIIAADQADKQSKVIEARRADQAARAANVEERVDFIVSKFDATVTRASVSEESATKAADWIVEDARRGWAAYTPLMEVLAFAMAVKNETIRNPAPYMRSKLNSAEYLIQRITGIWAHAEKTHTFDEAANLAAVKAIMNLMALYDRRPSITSGKKLVSEALVECCRVIREAPLRTKDSGGRRLPEIQADDDDYDPPRPA